MPQKETDDQDTLSRSPRDDRPSKSQVKRDMETLLELGKRLVELPSARVDRLDLDEPLRDAIELAQRIHSREGRRRQIHYVGKLLRRAPADALRARLDAWSRGTREQTLAMHRLEALRDLLLRDNDALTELLNEYPAADAQHLRTLIRAARKERDLNLALPDGREPTRRHYRALFQAIKAFAADTPSDAATDMSANTHPSTGASSTAPTDTSST